MRRAALALAGCLAAGCASSADPGETCGFPVLDRAVIVLERGASRSALARLHGGCIAEALDSSDGLDRVHLDASEPVSQVVREGRLGGSITALAWASQQEAYALVAPAFPGPGSTKLVAFDPSQPASDIAIRVLAEEPSFDGDDGPVDAHHALALTRDFVLVGERTLDVGRIRVFSRKTGAEEAVIPTKNGLPWALVALPL